MALHPRTAGALVCKQDGAVVSDLEPKLTSGMLAKPSASGKRSLKSIHSSSRMRSAVRDGTEAVGRETDVLQAPVGGMVDRWSAEL